MSVAQQTEALAKANRIRLTNADLCREIRRAESDSRSIVANILLGDVDDSPAGAIPIRRLLLAVPRFGEARMVRYLRAAGVFSGDRRVRDLTFRQRKHLASWLHAGVGFGSGATIAFEDDE